MNGPKISVLMPTYNYGRFLPDAIESVLDQTFQNFELLILNDCSTDNSAEVIEHYAARDPRIRSHVNSTNLGMVRNCNLCMEMAEGEYLKFLFSDDTLADKSALERFAKMLDQNPSATLAACARKVVDQNSRPITVWAQLGSSGLKRGDDIILLCLREMHNLIGEPSAVMFRKRDAGRGFSSRYRQIMDQEFWMHLLEKGDLVYTSEPLSTFRTHPAQETEMNRATKLGEKEHLLLLEDYLQKPLLRSPKGRSTIFNNLYRIRIKRNSPPGLEEALLNTIGQRWYQIYWLRHKMIRPFKNLRQSVQKRSRQAS
ncbi:MAG: glycosyltransferase family 2 protein [Limisphaerales bacterium]